MDTINSIKAVFSGSDTKASIYDEKFNLIWQNSKDNPRIMYPDELIGDLSLPLTLPIETELVCKHWSGIAVKVIPMKESDRISCYLLVFYDFEDIQRLYSRSAKLEEQKDFFTAVRTSFAEVLSDLEVLELNNSNDTAIKEDIKNTIIKTLGSLVNIIEAGKAYSADIEVFDMNLSERLNETAEFAAPLLLKNGCRLKVDIEQAVFVRTNYELLESALLNIIINGFMYCSAEKPELVLSLHRSKGQLRLGVSDNGEDADLEKIRFDSVYSGAGTNDSRHKRLGLVIAHKAAESLNGTLEFSHSDTGGLLVEICFPEKELGDHLVFKMKPQPRTITPLETQQLILSKGLKKL